MYKNFLKNGSYQSSIIFASHLKHENSFIIYRTVLCKGYYTHTQSPQAFGYVNKTMC